MKDERVGLTPMPARHKSKRVEVLQAWRETNDITAIRTARPDGFDFEPGQFANVTLATPEGDATNAYSMASGPRDDHLEFACRQTPSAFTDRFHELEKGDEIGVSGPFGRFTLRDDDAPRVLVCGGVGVTPFLSMIRDLADRSPHARTDLVCSNRTPDSIPYRDVLAGLARDDGDLHVRHAVTRCDRDAVTEAGLPDDTWRCHVAAGVLEEAGLLDHERHYYVCGPPAMVHDLVEGLTDAGIGDDRLHEEKFAGT